MKLTTTSTVSWGPDRIDLFAVGIDNALYHKAWDSSAWLPSPTTWERLGGTWNSPPTAVSWGPNRIDLFAIGTDNSMYHKAWDGSAWSPSSPDSWEQLGGSWSSPPAAVCWGPDRIDLFALGFDSAIYHKAWNGAAWLPSPTAWERLGGTWNSAPAAVSWGPDRIDLFTLGTDNALYHKAWDGTGWSPSSPDIWEQRGGIWNCPPAVVSWGPNRIDILAVGTDSAMYHQAWDGDAWSPWKPLGGTFTSSPAAICWGPNRIDLFAIGTDNSMYHKAWDGSAWSPSSPDTWEQSGGVWSSAPAVASWGPNRIDLFALGTDFAMYHKAWNGSVWSPSPIEVWEPLGGNFTLGQPLRFSTLAAAPTSGLASASNYIFADISNNNIVGLHVDILIGDDLVAAPITGENGNTEYGFSFQLNCQSSVDLSNPSNPERIVWQQYTIIVQDDVAGWVNNWTAASLPTELPTISPPAQPFGNLAQPNILPAGSQLSIQLECDSVGNVSGVTFYMKSGGTSMLAPVSIPLIGQPLRGGGNVTRADLAPIVAFTLNVVGPEDGVHAHFTSGTGAIYYGCLSPIDNTLMTLPSLPSSVAHGAFTAESANSLYGQLPPGPEPLFVQSIWVDPQTW